MEETGTITNLVNRLSAGELLSRDDLFPVVYAELRAMAQYRLHNEPRGVPATELVHQVYLKLFGAPPAEGPGPGHNGDARGGRWQNRAHFFGSAARAMEHLLIDAARRAKTQEKYVGHELHGDSGAGFNLARLPSLRPGGGKSVDVLILAEALRELAAQDADLAEVVRLRLYLGQTAEAAAETLGRSLRAVHRDWALARAWLLRRMKQMEGS